MSWRLEERDLSGAWYLNDDEVTLILNRIQQISQSTWSDQSLVSLKEWIAQQGGSWKKNMTYQVALKKWQKVCEKKQKALSEYLLSHSAVEICPKKTSSWIKQCTPRLEELVSLYPPGTINIDLGTDHSYLPIRLLKGQNAPFAFAVDIASSPLINAKKKIDQARLNGQICLIKGNGITPFLTDNDLPMGQFTSLDDSHEKQWLAYRDRRAVTVTICGVGGQLASEMILALPDWVGTVITQANDQPILVDQALSKRWEINLVAVSLENKRIFLTKAATLKKLIIHEGTNQPNINEAHHPNLMLWHWVCLSRATKRLSLTPKHHESCYKKEKELDLAIKQFFSIK